MNINPIMHLDANFTSLKISPNTFRKAPTRLYINILQQRKMTIGIADPLAIKPLENGFPRRISQVVFHIHIKALCKMVKVEGLCLGLRITIRLEGKKL